MTAAPLRKTANMLWQYLAEVDLLQGSTVEMDPVQVRAGQQLEMDWETRQKVFVKVPPEQGPKDQGAAWNGSAT